MRRGKVVRGRFGDRCSRTSGLPPELVTLLDVERKKRMWRRYLPLWGGAVAVGLVVGIGPSILRGTPTVPGDPQPKMAVQTALEEKPTAVDQEWASRAVDSADAAPAGVTTAFGFCQVGGGTNCVVDGDTLWFQGQKVRVADIDAPETHDYRCPEEKALGDRATQRLNQLVTAARLRYSRLTATRTDTGASSGSCWSTALASGTRSLARAWRGITRAVGSLGANAAFDPKRTLAGKRV